MLRPFALTIHVPGTLSANLRFNYTVPFDCTLRQVSAVTSNDADTTITVGTSADTDGFLASTAIGDSNTPAEFDRGDFDGALVSGNEARLSDGDVLVALVDYDGASGTAGADLTLVLMLEEG
jgi:hypothetical protein